MEIFSLNSKKGSEKYKCIIFDRTYLNLGLPSFSVAQHESLNKMSANGIAIIFAPTVLKSSRNMPAQDSLLHVPKQTM